MKDLKEYFVKDLNWGLGYQANKVFQLLSDASSFCDGGVILDAGAGHMRYKPFFENCIYLSQEHPDGIQLKNMGEKKYDLISPLDLCIPLNNDCVDVIISMSVLEHMRYPEKFFKEAFRVLKPGGKIFINVPFTHPEHEIPFDFQRPTRYGLKRWFDDAGFDDFYIEPSSSSIESASGLLIDALRDDLLKGVRRKDLKISFNLAVFIILRFITKGYIKLLKAFADR
jgi:SAM-dependent methyltransferase